MELRRRIRIERAQAPKSSATFSRFIGAATLQRFAARLAARDRFEHGGCA